MCLIGRDSEVLEGKEMLWVVWVYNEKWYVVIKRFGCRKDWCESVLRVYRRKVKGNRELWKKGGCRVVEEWGEQSSQERIIRRIIKKERAVKIIVMIRIWVWCWKRGLWDEIYVVQRFESDMWYILRKMVGCRRVYSCLDISVEE